MRRSRPPRGRETGGVARPAGRRRPTARARSRSRAASPIRSPRWKGPRTVRGEGAPDRSAARGDGARGSPGCAGCQRATASRRASDRTRATGSRTRTWSARGRPRSRHRRPGASRFGEGRWRRGRTTRRSQLDPAVRRSGGRRRWRTAQSKSCGAWSWLVRGCGRRSFAWGPRAATRLQVFFSPPGASWARPTAPGVLLRLQVEVPRRAGNTLAQKGLRLLGSRGARLVPQRCGATATISQPRRGLRTPPGQ